MKEFEQGHGCIYTCKVTGPGQISNKNGKVKTICHLFSRRRHSQNRHVENASFMESFIEIS